MWAGDQKLIINLKWPYYDVGRTASGPACYYSYHPVLGIPVHGLHDYDYHDQSFAQDCVSTNEISLQL